MLKSMKCQKCDSKKDLIKNSVTSSGKIQYICRKCNRERIAKYFATPRGKERRDLNAKKTYRRYKNKQTARALVNYSLTIGDICKPENCEDCSKKRRLFGHHPDYSKPLEVIWLCLNCHSALHRKLKIN